VDHHAQPFQERLNLDIAIDHNQVIQVRVGAEGRKTSAQSEILDLEFGISLPVAASQPDGTEGTRGAASKRVHATPKPLEKGTVTARSNVTNVDDRGLIPGDLAGSCCSWDQLTTKQRSDFMYYQPCTECGRTAFQIAEEGCDECAAVGRALSNAEALRRCQERRAQPKKAS
jgi:hypothetical protein